MRVLRPAHANEMVLAFLKAEIESPRVGHHYERFLLELGLDHGLIAHADLSDDVQNEQRGRVLDRARGYVTRVVLFQGFPANVQWYRIALSRNDLPKVRYIDDGRKGDWVCLSSGTRLVSDGARTMLRMSADQDPCSHIWEIARGLRDGKSYPELILVSKNLNTDMVLLEGHVRATAYVLAADALPDEIEALLGCSESMGGWVFL